MAQPPASLAYSDLERLAVSIAKSGLFGIKTPDQAIALMLIAQAEGRHPALAARDYDIISGRPSKKAEAMLRDFFDASGKVEWHALDDTIADATFSHPQGGSVRIVWDMARAGKAGLGGKDNWKKFPRQMLRSRTVSEGVRTVWPLATSGMYEPGEVSDMAPAGSDPIRGATIEGEIHRGPTTETTVEPPAPPAPPQQRRTTKTIGEWLDAFELAARDLQSAEEADRLITSPQALWAQKNTRGNAKERYDAVITAVMQTWFPPGTDDPAPPDDVPTEPPT